MANRKLIVEVIGDSRSFQKAMSQSSTSARLFGSQVDSTATKLDKSVKSFSGFAKGAAAGFGGAVAFNVAISGLRSVISAAHESEQVLGQTQVALESAGLAWADYGDEIESAIKAQSRLGFDDEALLRTFSLFVRQSKSVTEALRRNSIAMNVARARFIDLEQAAALVNKAALGQAGALRRVGIDARTGASGIELLAQLEQQFAGSAEDASRRAVGATDRLKVSLENVQETIGGALLPAVTELAVTLSDAADGATFLVQKLRDLGNVKIPVINIPVNFSIPGTDTDIGGALKEFALQVNPVTGPVRRLRQAIDAIKGDESGAADTKAAADAFGKNVPGFLDNLAKQSQAATGKAKAAADAVKSFGEKGFKPLTKSLAQLKAEAANAQLESLDLGLARAQIDASVTNDLTALLALKDGLQKAIKAGVDVASNQTRLAGVMRDIRTTREQITAERQQSQATTDANFLAGLQLGIDRAGLDANLNNDLSALLAMKAGIEQLVAAGRDVSANESRLVQVVADIAAKRQEIRNKAAQELQAKQFRALGLAADGSEIIPGVENLEKRLKGVLSRIASGDLDIGSKLAERLKLSLKIIKKEGKALEKGTREAIDGFLKAATGQDSKVKTGPRTQTSGLNTKKFIEGLGLSGDQARDLRGRLSGLNSAGVGNVAAAFGGSVSGPVVVESHTTVELDGAVVGKSVTRSQQKKKRRNPPQRRGPNRSGL